MDTLWLIRRELTSYTTHRIPASIRPYVPATIATTHPHSDLQMIYQSCRRDYFETSAADVPTPPLDGSFLSAIATPPVDPLLLSLPKQPSSPPPRQLLQQLPTYRSQVFVTVHIRFSFWLLGTLCVPLLRIFLF